MIKAYDGPDYYVVVDVNQLPALAQWLDGYEWWHVAAGRNVDSGYWEIRLDDEMGEPVAVIRCRSAGMYRLVWARFCEYQVEHDRGNLPLNNVGK